MNSEPVLNPVQRLALTMLRLYVWFLIGVGLACLVTGIALGWWLSRVIWP